MDYKFILFIFLAVILVSGGAYRFYAGGQEITAALFFIGAIGAMVFFGLRWFASGKTKGSVSSWPPAINYCPDFLTLAEVGGKKVCVDTIGIYKGGIRKWTGPTQTSQDYVFNLSADKSGKARVDALCAECARQRVSWEGVYDGSVCVGNEPPLPPSS